MPGPDGHKHYHIGAAEMVAPKLAPALYLVATPIGNLRDVTLRALETLAAVDLVYCEDTRVTAKLLERYGIRNHLRACHEHNEQELASHIVAEIAAGKSVALASDAGLPLISDPGFRLVNAAVAAGLQVISIPGASATLTALQVSGLATDQFLFLGFLPQKQKARLDVLRDHIAATATLIAYESPHRLVASLADIATVYGGRAVVLARELTKLHEEVLRGPAATLATTLGSRETIKGECVLVIAGASETETQLDEAAIARILKDAAANLPASKAASQASRLTGLPRDEAFKRILALKEKSE